MNLIEHTLLTLDFWQDNVTYEGKSMPTGTLACAALNLSDEVIAKLSQLCMPLNLYMGSLQLGQANTAQMEAARESVFQIVERADDHPLKKIYERRTNTIIQKLHRGTLDEQTAAVMKRLAKNKLERAIADREYAARLYEAEMAQERLLAEAQSYLK